MSYKTYTTEAIVCGSRANNTSDKAFLLFTREAGMLWASARSVREERSKQRFALQDFSLIRVSLVRGKSGWRIGSAECQDNYFTDGNSHAAKLARTGVVSAIRLLRQFLHGEVAQPDLFDDAKKALSELSTDEKVQASQVFDIFNLRLLYKLGYIASSDELGQYLSADNWCNLPSLPVSAKKAIENANRASHL